ncbi:MAG: preprotein translocase subunit SecA, partial [Flavisolibacter sp.]|nr:preprotein translocase subunit SecA [Flavisolibacter sp.]
MIGFFSKIFGGSKSEKDVRTVMPLVSKINDNFKTFPSLSNDELRNKTQEFRKRINDHVKDIEQKIIDTNNKAEQLDFNDLTGKDAIYQEVDDLKKERDDKIEEVLKELLPEAFAVVKETARRFKENTQL